MGNDVRRPSSTVGSTDHLEVSKRSSSGREEEKRRSGADRFASIFSTRRLGLCAHHRYPAASVVSTLLAASPTLRAQYFATIRSPHSRSTILVDAALTSKPSDLDAVLHEACASTPCELVRDTNFGTSSSRNFPDEMPSKTMHNLRLDTSVRVERQSIRFTKLLSGKLIERQLRMVWRKDEVKWATVMTVCNINLRRTTSFEFFGSVKMFLVKSILRWTVELPLPNLVQAYILSHDS